VTLVHHLLRETASRHPSRPALICDGRIRTFAEIDAESDQVACDLQRGGIARGDRVALIADNTAAAVVSIFGILKAGAVLVPVSPLARPERLAGLLDDCGARALLSTARLATAVATASTNVPSLERIVWLDPPPQTGPRGLSLPEIVAGPRAFPTDAGLIDQDLAAIIYTSGSTGHPKGVMLTHRNLVNTTAAIASYLGNTPDDVVMCVLPLSHTYGLCQVLVGARVGYAVALERSFAYPFDVLRRMAEYRVTGLPAVPTIFAQLLQMPPLEGLDLSSLRYVTNAAAGLPPAHVRRLQEMFPAVKIFLMYGQTECTRTCYLDPSRALEKPDSVGKAIPNSEAYVADEAGRRAAPGIIGELVVRGANVMRGYWGMPEETARSLRDGGIPGEKVLHTGDLFRMDSEGLLYFVGRRDDVFKCRGEKVSPAAIESVLHELEDVIQADVMGIDDPTDGTAIRAAVVLRPGATLAEPDLRRHCRKRLEPYLVPRFIDICDALPRTESGKLDRRALALGAKRRADGRP
jgi:amino acid adenylation domain-containing protein